MQNQMDPMEHKEKLILLGIVVALFIVAYIVNTGVNHGGRHGGPCYCKVCEDKIIDAANKGDVAAQQKLAAAIEGGAYKGDTPMGPLALLVGAVVLLGLAYAMGLFGAKYAAPLSGFMEGKLRGR